jgi:WD40 repeat protein
MLALVGWITRADAQKDIRKAAPGFGQGGTAPALADTAVGQPPAAATGRLIQRFGTNHFRHGSRILCLKYRPDGRILAAGGGADPVRVWDVDTGEQKLTLPETWVNAIAFSPRGSVMMTAGTFKIIKVWETDTGKEIARIEGHAAPIKAMALNPIGDLLASGGQDGTIILWEPAYKKKVMEFKDHTDEITCLAFCEALNIGMLVSGSNDRTVRVWDSDNNKLISKIDAGCGVLAVAITPDGKTVFSGGDDNLIRVWDAQTGKLLDTLKGHADMVVSLAVIDKGKTLVSGGRDQAIRLWDLANRQANPRVIQRHLGDSDALAVTRDGTRIATAGLNNTIRIFDAATGKEQFAGNDPQAGLNSLALSKDGKRLAAVTAPGIVYLWDAQSGKLEHEWASGHTGEITLAFTPDGQSIVTAAETIRFWDPQTGKQIAELPRPAKDAGPVLSLAFSPDNTTLAVGSRDQRVTLYKGKTVVDTFTYPGQPYALAFSLDNRLLSVSGSSKIALRDVAGKKELRQFECKDNDAPPKTLRPDVAALAFSPDRKTLAVACFDGVIRMLDFNTGKEVGNCEGHQSVPYSIAYSQDGRTLLSGSFDSTARLWEPFSGLLLAELKGHVGPIYGVALSPDGRVAYSAGADTSVLVWDTTGYGKAGPPQAPLNSNEFQQAWKDLASENAAAARLVVWRWIGNPQGASEALKGLVHLVDVARITKLIGDLDSDDYDDRKRAFDELEKQGRWLEGRLHEALAKPPSLEYKRRVEQLLEKLNAQGSLSLRQEQLRMRRALMVLEYLGDPAAVDLLGRMTKQAPEEPLRQEAQMTLMRMGR